MEKGFKGDKFEREQDSSPTMEEIGKMLAGYGGMYFLYKGDPDRGEYSIDALEDYVQRCISLLESPKEKMS